MAVDLERALAFSAAGYLFAASYPRRIWLVSAVVLTSVLGLEIIQQLLPDRHGQVHDALVKGAGACVGLGLGWLSTHAVNRLKQYK